MNKISRFHNYNELSITTKVLFSLNLGLLLFFPFVLRWFYATGTPFDALFLWFNINYYDFSRTHLDSIAIFTLSGLASAILFLCLQKNTKWTGLLVDSACFLSFLLIFNVIRLDIAQILSRKMLHEHWILFSIGALAFLIFAIKYRVSILALSRLTILLLTPITILMSVNLIWAGMLLAPAESGILSYSAPLAPIKQENKPKQRVVWLIFDELDYRFLFDYPLPDVERKNFQRLRNETFLATNAFPPANLTYLSMPILTTGLDVKKTEDVPNGDFKLTLSDEKIVRWKKSPNIFLNANNSGARVAIFGDLRTPPYCKLFHQQAEICWEQSRPWISKNSVARRIPVVLNGFLKTFPGLQQYLEKNERTYHTEFQANRNIEFTKGIRNALSNPDLDFIFAHISVPHTPIIYDRIKNDYLDGKNNRPVNYLDNLELADKMFGEFRSELEKSGLWDKTNIIISADHSCRDQYCSVLKELKLKQDKRVPFIVKLSGQKNSVVHTRRLHTIQTRKLVIEILKRNISVAEIPSILHN